MAIATVACPKCKQDFRSTDDVKGTRIRCPLCGTAFVVQRFTDNEPAVVEEEPRAKAATNDEDDPNPLGMTTVEVKARCPNCANEMESDDAIICLHCGYNTQLRTLGKTKRTVHQSGGDKLQWLLPGLGCLVGVFVLILLHNIYILQLGAEARGTTGFMSFFYTEPIYLWATIISAGVIWAMGRFAFYRLIVQPTPPEQTVD